MGEKNSLAVFDNRKYSLNHKIQHLCPYLFLKKKKIKTNLKEVDVQ